jgi:hypothetical protein
VRLCFVVEVIAGHSTVLLADSLDVLGTSLVYGFTILSFDALAVCD